MQVNLFPKLFNTILSFKSVMQRKLIFIVVLIFCANFLFASKTVIKGFAKGFGDQELSVYTFTDYITNNKKHLGYITINKDETFSFDVELSSISKIYIKIEDKTTWFFAEPGSVYNISLSYSEEFNKGRIYDKQLSLKFNFPAPNELNQEIKKYNQKYDAFFDENYLLFVKRDRSVEPKIKAFKTKMLKEVESMKSDFVKNHIIYSIAQLETTIDVSYNDNQTGKNSKNTKANLYLEYLDKKPVLYNNAEYMTFFKDFFKSELKDMTMQVSGLDVIKAINDKASFKAYNTALAKYPFLQQEEFKQLFGIYGLLRIANDKYFTRKNIISMLNEQKNGSIYPQQKIIASEILQLLTEKKLDKGTTPPDFKLYNQHNELISLQSFKGKYLYINFWATWNIPSQKEMKVMETLYKKYGNDIEFLSICTDNNIDKMNNFLKRNPTYTWKFLHIGKNQKLLDDFSVATVPTYIFIDDKLNIISAPAPRPGGSAERSTEENIEKYFFEITKANQNSNPFK